MSSRRGIILGMKIKIFSLILLVLLLTSAVFAETTIKAQVDKNKVTTDEALTYKVIIASTENPLPSPQFPRFTGFAVISQANSSTISFMQGGMKTLLVYAFILAPTSTGKFKIEPVAIKVKDEVFTSQTLEIEVTQGLRKPMPVPQKKNLPIPQETPTGPQEPQYTL